jgi:hypothetical protein
MRLGHAVLRCFGVAETYNRSMHQLAAATQRPQVMLGVSLRIRGEGGCESPAHESTTGKED